MIQRKQSLYTLIVIILFAVLFFTNLAKVTFVTDNANLLKAIGGDEGVVQLTIFKYYPLLILASLVIIVSAVCIASFKKMALQLRLSIVNIVLILGFIGFEIFAILRTFNIESNVQSTAGLSKFMSEGSQLVFNNQLGVTAVAPLLALIAAFMAFKGVSRDIFSINSFNRMR